MRAHTVHTAPGIGPRWLVLPLLLACLLLALPRPSYAAEAPYASGVPTAAATAAAPIEVDYRTNADVEVGEDHEAALMNGASFGITNYSRANTGSSRTYSGSSYGYRYPSAGIDGFVAVDTPDGALIVYIPEGTAQALGIDIGDAGFQRSFLATLSAIDSAAVNGGAQFAGTASKFYFTTERAVSYDGSIYGFGVEVEEGYYYATIVTPGQEDSSSRQVYAMTGNLAPASQVSIAGKPTGLAALARFFSNLDWRPLWVSLRTAGLGLIIIFILGLLAAWGTVQVSPRVKGILDTVFTIPMVLPPTVCGFLLLLIFGNSTALGRWFISHGVNIVFTWPAAVIACVVVSFPLMYRSARGAFEQLEAPMLDAARTLGWKEGRIFRKLMLPLAWPSIASGTVLAFARAIGEFGATLFFAGNYAGVTQTIPIAIYFDWMAGQTDVALFWVFVVILISFAVILFINVYSSRSQRYRHGSISEVQEGSEYERLSDCSAEAAEGARS